ncbi:alpha/beta fold hydrolase [bacterium]|nr:alpha/beta fold hydrolase [bacterium]
MTHDLKSVPDEGELAGRQNKENFMTKGQKRGRFLIGTMLFLAIIAVVSSLFLMDSETAENSSYKLTSETFTQPVNHNNPASETFEQEILILKPEGASLNSPVFFILGNEGDKTLKELSHLYEAYGAPEDITFIVAEHRGYGQSVTANVDQSLPDYITIDQALADYHRFITRYKTKYPGPWMAAGYSYGGGLVVNFAHKYHEDVKVILVSSAVIDWPFYMDTYDRQVKINLGDGLYERMTEHIQNLRPDVLFDQTWLEREFITNMTLGISQKGQYQSLLPVFRVLSYLPTGPFLKILRWMDTKVAKEAGWTAAQAFGKKSLSRTEAVTGKYNWYTWKYQQCKRTGTMWISEDPVGLFPKSKADNFNECKAMFGEDPPAATNSPWNPRAMVKNLSVPQVYVIGGKDPWTALCQEKTDWIAAEDYFYVRDGFHCPDRTDSELGKKVLARLLVHLN